MEETKISSSNGKNKQTTTMLFENHFAHQSDAPQEVFFIKSRRVNAQSGCRVIG